MSATIQAQSVDISHTRLTIGRSVAMQVRVRVDGGQTAPIAPHCIHAELVADNQLLPRDELRVSTQPDAAPDWTRVLIQHPHVVKSDAVQAQIQLRCGADFQRSFQVPISSARAQTFAPLMAPVRRSARDNATSPSKLTAVQASNGTADTTSNIEVSAAPRLDSAPSTVTPVATPTLSHQVDNSGAQPAPLMSSSGKDAAHLAQLLEAQQRLHEQHQRVLTQMNALKAQLVQDNLRPAPLSWVVIAALMALCLAALTRMNHARYAPVRSPMSSHRGAASDAGALTARITRPHPYQGAVSRQTTVTDTVPEQAPSAIPFPWQDGSFGTASLDDEGLTTILREVEQLNQQGFPAAATITLEQQLMTQEGKHPALLLALLDVYRTMDQPSNHDRVAAQLEALYNVRVPALHAPTGRSHLAEAGDLEQHPQALDRITRTWPGREAASAIASILLPSGNMPLLSLQAFREATWLHDIAKDLAQHQSTDIPELSLTPLQII